ncbi:MAG: catalase family peroxidase [Actinomycetota bacterium]
MQSGYARAIDVGGDLYEQLVDAANDVYGAHKGRRALHTKGFYCEGTFRASPEAAELTRAPHLQGDEVPVLIRLSVAGGDPDVHDGEREPRGMAIRFNLPDGAETDLLCVSSPVFPSRTPEDFLELLRLRKPDPETGQPDMEGLGEFLQSHPESMAAVQATLGTPPPVSYAQLVYNSIHSFKLVDGEGEGRWIRYRWDAEAGEERIEDDEEAKSRDSDHMRTELEERLGAGPAAFELQFVLAEEDDAIDDPTVAWPDDRRRIAAGRLEIERMVEDPEQGGSVVVFDPIKVIDGIELSDDPILHARPRAYSVSVERRA